MSAPVPGCHPGILASFANVVVSNQSQDKSKVSQTQHQGNSFMQNSAQVLRMDPVLRRQSWVDIDSTVESDGGQKDSKGCQSSSSLSGNPSQSQGIPPELLSRSPASSSTSTLSSEDDDDDDNRSVASNLTIRPPMGKASVSAASPSYRHQRNFLQTSSLISVSSMASMDKGGNSGLQGSSTGKHAKKGQSGIDSQNSRRVPQLQTHVSQKLSTETSTTSDGHFEKGLSNPGPTMEAIVPSRGNLLLHRSEGEGDHGQGPEKDCWGNRSRSAEVCEHVTTDGQRTYLVTSL